MVRLQNLILFYIYSGHKFYHSSTTNQYPDTPQTSEQPLVTVELTSVPDRNESCIQCAFSEWQISSCVAIIHMSASYLSSKNGLLAFNVIKIDREWNGTVASHCIKQEQLNLTNHVVTVFSYHNGSIVGPAIVLQKKKVRPINGGII